MTLPATAPHSPAWSARLYCGRLWAILLRHFYLHIGSWPRIAEMLYWPVINMLIWGFVSLYLTRQMTGAAAISSALVAAVLLIEIFMRVSVNLLVLFLEEIWSRNLGHLFASPITFRDYLLGLIMTALIRTAIALVPVFILAAWLFHFSLFGLGWSAAWYVLLLAINGCWYGMLIMALLLRFGMAAEWLGWMATQFLVPLIAPSYPVSVLPTSLQLISRSLPATYVFEDMKTVIGGKPDHQVSHLVIAGLLNLIYLGIACFVLRRAYRGARRRGGLLQVGE